MWESLIEYIVVGRPTGEFLAAVLSDRLRQAVIKADAINMQRLYDYCIFLDNCAPAGCHGSPTAFNDWLRSGGVMGRQRAIDQGQVAP